jgi:DNA-binding response OmpR family regulator
MAKILLIDDDTDLVAINKTLLEKDGHQVVFAHNPKDGMEALHRENPDLLILDVMMEEADDGFALAQKIRREGNHLPILMLTSVAKVTGMKFGKDNEMVPVNEFMEKPIPAETLRKTVKKLLK